MTAAPSIEQPTIAALLAADEPSWWLAHPAAARLAAGPPAGPTDSGRGLRRLATWRQEPVFTDDERGWFESYLAELGTDEAGLTALLGEPAETVRSRFREVPEHVTALARAWERYADAPAPAAPAADDHEHAEGCDHEHTGTAGGAAIYQQAFADTARPLFAEAADRIRAAVERLAAARPSDHLDAAALTAQLTQPPYVGAIQMLTRTLVLELNVLRVQGELAGDTAEERFDDFTRRLADPTFVLGLLREYPVLARDLVRLTDSWAETRIEFAERLVADLDQLVERLDDPGTVATVTFGAGDSHRGGRSVAIVTFTGGASVVYKPREIAVDQHFQDLLRWVNDHGQEPALRTIWVLDRGDYGWTEFVSAAPCDDDAALVRFYRRQGAYVALLHAMAATDFHFENLIASGEDPVLIDLEALFHGWQPPTPELVDMPVEAFRQMRASVLSVGLLPNPIAWHDEDDDIGQVDLSGLSGKAGQLSPTAVPTWDDPRTDRMRLVRRRVEMTGGSNLPSLNGDAVDALDYRDALTAGFEAMYRLLLDNRDELLAADGPLVAFAADEIRVIIRPTRTYMLLLLESWHPDLMRDALDRDRFFANIWSGHDGVPEQERIVGAELAQLHRGDVPIFSTSPGSRDLVSGADGSVIPAVLPQSGLDRSTERIRAMSGDDLVRQRWFVDATLATIAMGADTMSRPTGTAAGAEAAPADADPVLAASRVGDRLLALSMGEESPSWLGLNLVDDRLWQLSPTSMDLYNGLSGIALFLGQLGAVTGDERYRTTAERTAAVMVRQVELLAELPAERLEHSGVGAFTGLGSTVYALAHLDALWGRPDLAEAAQTLLGLAADKIDSDRALDVIAGSAGGALAALALHAVRPRPETLAVAGRMADHLAATATEELGGLGWRGAVEPDTALGGFSHGASGVAVALARVDRARGERRYEDLVRGALAFERSLYEPDTGNWTDRRAIAKEGARMVAWCHGAAGIGLARADLLDYLGDDPEVAAELAAAVRTVQDEGVGHSNHSICHGDLGNLEVLAVAARRTSDTALAGEVRRETAGLLAAAGADRWMCGVPLGVETPGLLSGLAGIGYNLLRLAEPERVPSVLLVEAPRVGTDK